jgi:hypothetical protein
MSQVSGRLGQLGSIEDSVELAIDLGQGGGQRSWHRLGRVEGGAGGPEDAGVELGEQQRHPIALHRDAVALRVGHAPPQPLQAQPPPVVGHLPGRVGGEVEAARGDDWLVTLVGTLADLTPGEAIVAHGWWRNDPKHGWQFQALDYRTILVLKERSWGYPT